MHIRSLQSQFFRNINSENIELNTRFNVIFGENAQGKTNLLESAYLLLRQQSFRATRLAELIRFGEKQARVSGQIEDRSLIYEVKLALTNGSKKVELNGNVLRGVAQWPRKLTAVLFTSDDLRVLKGLPNDRRKFIDRAIAASWPNYSEITKNYQRALRGRNRLLRDRPTGLSKQLDAYDDPLTKWGCKIIEARARYLDRIRTAFIEGFGRIMELPSPVDIQYRTHPALRDVAADNQALQQVFGAQLLKVRQVDVSRAATSIGPHVDDVEFLLEHRSARGHASQGQMRALILAFKIAEIKTLFDQIDTYPVLMLDDVSSELDSRRNAYLFSFLMQVPCQLMLTTARRELIPKNENTSFFQVLNGCVERVMPLSLPLRKPPTVL